MNKNAVCITVYKYRSTTMLKNLSKIDSNKYDVYIVAQKNDPCNEEYYKHSENVLIPDVTSIFQKREYIRNEMSRRGYEGFFMIDDDVNFKIRKITKETKRTTSNSYSSIVVDFNEALDAMVNVAIEYDAGYVSTHRTQYLGFSKPDKIAVNKSLNVAQFGYFRLDKLDKYNLHYDTSGYINEDLDIVMQMLQHGIKCCNICYYGFTVSNIMYKNMNTSTLYDDLETNFKLISHQYIKYRIPMFLDNHGFLRTRKPYHKYFNTFELPEADPILMDLCKSDDVKGIVDYLIKTGKNNIRI